MEKKKKELILLGLAVVLILVTAVTLLPKKPKVSQAVAAASSSSGSKTSDSKPASKEAAKTGKGAALPTPGELLGGSSGNSPNRNPFAAPAAARAATNSTTPSAAKPAATAAPAGTPAGNGNLPPFFPQNPNPMAAAAAPVEPLQLSGVMLGDQTIAVVRRGETRFFVHVGDAVENYRVTSIGSSRITLKSKEGNQIILHLGGGA
jgi:hypothetical protein